MELNWTSPGDLDLWVHEVSVLTNFVGRFLLSSYGLVYFLYLYSTIKNYSEKYRQPIWLKTLAVTSNHSHGWLSQVQEKPLVQSFRCSPVRKINFIDNQLKYFSVISKFVQKSCGPELGVTWRPQFMGLRGPCAYKFCWKVFIAKIWSSLFSTLLFYY